MRATPFLINRINRIVFYHFLGALLLLPHEGLSQVAQVVKGPSTNGLYGEIDLNWNTNKSQALEINVSVIDSKADQIFGEGHLGTNGFNSFVKNMSDNSWPYFQATNSFCGPIELKSANGQTIPLMKPAVSSPEAYPKTYSLSGEWTHHFFTNHPAHSGGAMIFPPPLARNVSELASFQLQDYFEISQPGQYEFTVWPKIYRRSPVDSDTCERLDLPPVSAKITLR